VFLPNQRVLFTGDLVETRFFPIFPWFPPDDADVDGSRWINVLTRLESLEPEVVVPGHGEVGGPELIREVREYLEDVRARVAQAADGRTAEEVKAELEPAIRSSYASWDAPEWIGFAVECFFAKRDA
jgi:glyoxylase-like metal-dependent hydrolase (beta-lactamase superfamily II)